MQDSKRDTDIKNRLLDSVGEGEGGMIWENRIETCIFSSVQFSRSVESNSLRPHEGLLEGDSHRKVTDIQPTRLVPVSWPLPPATGLSGESVFILLDHCLLCVPHVKWNIGGGTTRRREAQVGARALSSLSVTSNHLCGGGQPGPPAAWLGVWVQQDLLTPLHPFLIFLGTWKLCCLLFSLSCCCCHNYYFFFFCIFQTKTTKCVIQLACPEMSNLDWERAWYQILGGKRTTHTRRHNAILSFLLFLSLRRSVINGNMSLFSTKSFFSNLYK